MENGKIYNIQYPSIFNMVQCPSPQALHYPTIPRLGVPKGGAAGGGENDKEMHRDIHIQQKSKKKERRGKKKTTLSLCLHPKVAVHTYFHTSDDTQER
jgi:hypothetical protein